MAYDRHDTRDAPRDERPRWRDDRNEGRDDRGFFERAGDEVASWFGDEDAERRRNEDRQREGASGGRDRDPGRERARDRDWLYGREDRGFRDREWERGQSRGYSTSERDYNPSWRQESSNRRDYGRGNLDRERERDRGYRPMTGNYAGRAPESDQFFAASGYGQRGYGDYSRDDDGESQWGRDEYRRTSRAGTSDWTDRSRHQDPHYRSWRDRQMQQLDSDYDDYRRENQSRFEDEFGSWRERRQQKRGLLGKIREHMEVVGNDDQHVGTIDKTAGDRIILAKSDPDSGGVHHSLSCSDIDRVEGDRVILGCSAEQAKKRWRDENRSRALFEREDQGEMGPRNLDRSFEGTYR